MKKLGIIAIKMLFGFFLVANSTILALNSDMGLSPWDVFHQGLSIVTGITIGQASIAVGVALVVISRLMKLPIGFGTVANMIIIGCFTDLVNMAGYIPVSHNLITGIPMILGSLILMAVGCALYLSCALGCGPRDGLMTALSRRIGRKVGIVRLCMEMFALLVGWLLGGKVGVGTFIIAFGTGFCMQLVFKLFRMDVRSLQHKSFKESIDSIRNWGKKAPVCAGEAEEAAPEGMVLTETEPEI